MRFFIMTVLLMFGTFTAFTQENLSISKRSVMGIRGGMSYGLIKLNDKYFNGIGMQLGVLSDFHFTERSCVRTSFQVSVERNIFHDADDLFGLKFDFREIAQPVLTGFSALYLRQVSNKWSLFAGPNLEYIFRHSSVRTITFNGATTVSRLNLGQDSFFGVQIGGIYRIRQQFQVGIELRQNLLTFSNSKLSNHRSLLQSSVIYLFN